MLICKQVQGAGSNTYKEMKFNIWDHCCEPGLSEDNFTAIFKPTANQSTVSATPASGSLYFLTNIIYSQ